MMHSFTTFLAASAVLGFAAASPLISNQCPPEQYHTCGDGWKGCCTVSPCYAINGKSGCPDGAEPPSQNPTTITPPSTPTSTYIISTSATTSATACDSSSTAPPKPEEDFVWKDSCKEDNSNCNWSPMFWMIQTYNETYTRNLTNQFYVQKDAAMDKRRDVIAVFKDLPADRKNCSLSWYKPAKGIFYGTYNSGLMNISILDLGDKTLAEATGGDINYKNVKGLFEKQTSAGGLDLANWGSTTHGQVLDNARKFDCPGKEVAFHFELAEGEGAVIHDQVADRGGNSFVRRAGWFLKWE